MDEQNDPQVESLPEYDEASFLSKAGRVLKRVGQEALEKLFLAYHVMRDPLTPLRDKSLLAGSLAYFVLPFDKIPDWIVGLGYTDDLSLLAIALAKVAASTRPEHHDLARKSIEDIVKRMSPSDA